MPPRSKPSIIHVNDLILYQTAVQAAVNEWTLHRVLSFDQSTIQLIEYDPDKSIDQSINQSISQSGQVISVKWPSSSIALYQPFSSYSKAQCYALALTGEPQSINQSINQSNQSIPSSLQTDNQSINQSIKHWTTVYYACTVQKNMNKKAAKDRMVVYSSDQSQCFVDLEVKFYSNQSINQSVVTVPGIIQTISINAEVVNASCVAAGIISQSINQSINQSIDPHAVIPLGEKRKRNEPIDVAAIKAQRTENKSYPTIRPDQSINQSINQAIKQSTSQSINQSVNQSMKLTLPVKKKPRAWYLPMPSFGPLINASIDQSINQPLTIEEADGETHIKLLNQSINQSVNQSDLPYDHNGYIDALGCWHDWDSTKPLPSRRLVAAAYSPDLSFK